MAHHSLRLPPPVSVTFGPGSVFCNVNQNTRSIESNIGYEEFKKSARYELAFLVEVFKKTSTLCKSILVAEISMVEIVFEYIRTCGQNQILQFPYLRKLRRNEAPLHHQYLGNQPMDFIEIITQSKQNRFIGF